MGFLGKIGRQLWRPTKISIRLSILSILLGLLVGVALLIISINYFALNSVLIDSATSFLRYSSEKVGEQLSTYLEPLNAEVAAAFKMLNQGVVKPAASPEFTRFLYNIVNNEEHISGVYWGDPAGNLYWLNKTANGNFLVQDIVRRGEATHVSHKVFNSQLELLSVEKSSFATLDPRQRPWYHQAQLKRQPIWIVYKFIKIGTQGTPLGVTAAVPLYDKRGKLMGVFGVDMLIESIYSYMSDIKVTKNSTIFIVDGRSNIISIGTPKEDKLFQGNLLPTVAELHLPWLKRSVELYYKQKKSPFIYSYGKSKYISAYARLLESKDMEPWFVAIVAPIDDIIAPLRHSMVIALIFIGVVLLLGIMIASIFSASLSRPITKLARDADWICQLKLTKLRALSSRIKEIADMAASFTKMKKALQSFQLYMPVEIVRQLIASNRVATVGGELKELTIVFTDIQNFTNLSENIRPEELMPYLSRYFQVIAQVVISLGGTIDKYIGDGMMAFWGAPADDSEHACHACRAAIKIQQALSQLNQEWQRENRPEVVTRIGINTGAVIVGNVGSQDRLSYTALGDAVNLASRLESLNKIYKTSILVSETTYTQSRDRFNLRLIDRVAAKGKRRGIYIYELLEEGDIDLAPEVMQYQREFYAAFAAYEEGSWQVALTRFTSLQERYPDDPLVAIFKYRCAIFSTHPPAQWQGVWVMQEK